jgi:hypothetical protein
MSASRIHASARPRWPRALKRALILLAVLSTIALVLTAFAAWMIHQHGAYGAVLVVRERLAIVRPIALAIEIAVLALAWWYWTPLVKRARFAPKVEAVWLAARHRLAGWGIAFIALGAMVR